MLLEVKDDKYKEFQAKLVPNISSDTIIGIRTPNIRNIAKTNEEIFVFTVCPPDVLFQFIVFVSVNALQPFVACSLAFNFNGEMSEPGILRRAVPMLYFSGNIDERTRRHLHGILPPFLIVAASADTNQQLTAAVFGVVNMPVIDATGLKGYIENRNLLC